jgi:neutral ceramidase
VASVDITPPLGIPMAGYYHARGADGVLDPLFSKAMIIKSGGERAAGSGERLVEAAVKLLAELRK